MSWETTSQHSLPKPYETSLPFSKKGGATPADVVQLTVYLVAPADVEVAFAAAQEVWGGHPTAVSVIKVSGLARPGCLVEISALAHVS
jgi:2-iminobutanoate/2-iminopropanoate deaminase